MRVWMRVSISLVTTFSPMVGIASIFGPAPGSWAYGLSLACRVLYGLANR